MEVPLLVNDFLHRAVKLYPGKEAVVDGDDRFTWEEFGNRVNAMANGLYGRGVRKGDRIAVLSPNSHQFLEMFYVSAQLGAIIVPINYRLIADDFRYILNHSHASTFIVDSEYEDIINSLRGDLPNLQDYIVARLNSAPIPDGWTDYESVLNEQSIDSPPDPFLDENDLISINYTSGTTARPKGVMITHRNCYLHAFSMLAHLRINQNDRELWTLPMFHANGWGGVFAITAVGGTHVVLRRIDGKEIYKLIDKERITFACMAPAVLATILEYPGKENHNITTRPRFVIAGAPTPLAFIERLEKELDWEFIQIYGLTETSPILTVSQIQGHLDTEGDVYYQTKARAGQEAIGTTVAVFDDTGQEVPWDDKSIGEVAARSNVVLKGYWQQPEATAEAIRNGWFYTGDLATVNSDGYINIVDRAKDVIISGGENISSIEIEDVLYKHTAVLEAAVIGIPSEQWGETPIAIIIPRDGVKVSSDEILQHCRDNMAHFKCPSHVEFVKTLPRTATGKLKKVELRESFWGNKSKRVN